jgi:glutamine kinase
VKQKYDFISKAQTLKFLSDKITTAKVLPLEIVRYDEWHNDSQKILDRLQNLPTERLIIRSSSKGEDTIDSSNAGRFLTVLDVDKNCLDDIRHSIEQVFSSYETNSVDDEVLVQPMLKDLTRSGVVFTSDIDTLAPYYIINYDEGDHSDTVTGGTTNSLKTHIVFRDSPAETGNKYIDSLVKTCKELEDIFNNSHLDVEFGFNKNNELYIFQVRPIVVSGKKDLARLNLEKPLRKIYKKFMKLSSPHPNLLGKKTIFGVMPDWNPAEIIGFRPKRLALSLYKELVMDNIWAYQRDNYGYRNLRSHPLLVSFLGVPFIDVRVSFNSFIPKDIHDSIAEKLCNFYLDKLENIPFYHDKVEFEIVFSCYCLNVSDKLKELLDYGFSENEVKRIEFSLLELTNRIIDPSVGLYKKDLEKISILEKKYDDIINSDLAIVDKIYWLSENCKRYGTLPFAGVARAAFVAVQFLRSFVSLNIITEEEYETFLKSVNTVNKKMNIDLKKLVNKKLSKEDFLKKYGHIRPGTYDILSLRYDENFDGYFNQTDALFEEDITDDFSFSKEQHEKIDKFLIENGIKSNSRDLIKNY